MADRQDLPTPRAISRRQCLRLGAAVLAGVPFIQRGRFRLFPGSQAEYSARAIRLVEDAVVVDMLNQFRFADYAETPPRSERWLRSPGSFSAADFETCRTSGRVGIVLTFQSADHFRSVADVDILGNSNPMNAPAGQSPRNQPNFERYQYHEDADGKIGIRGLDHPRRVFDLTEGLIARKYTDADIRRVLGGNWARVLGAAWAAYPRPGPSAAVFLGRFPRGPSPPRQPHFRGSHVRREARADHPGTRREGAQAALRGAQDRPVRRRRVRAPLRPHGG